MEANNQDVLKYHYLKAAFLKVMAIISFCFVYLKERCPPALDDYLFICDDAYARNEILDMERTMLMAVGFDLGIPLSYTFLRRYAQVSLTLTDGAKICYCHGICYLDQQTQNLWLSSNRGFSVRL